MKQKQFTLTQHDYRNLNKTLEYQNPDWNVFWQTKIPPTRLMNTERGAAIIFGDFWGLVWKGGEGHFEIVIVVLLVTNLSFWLWHEPISDACLDAYDPEVDPDDEDLFEWDPPKE